MHPGSETSRSFRAPRFLTALAAFLVLATAFSFAFTPLRTSQDEWWHLKAGRWIVEHRALPTHDIFTYAGADFRWYNHEWLSQVIFYLVYALGAGGDPGPLGEVGGVTALVAFKALIVTLTFALLAWLARLRGASWPAALFVALLAADISRRTIYPRPPVFSYLFFTLFLIAFTLWKTGRMRGRWLWLLVPVTVVWSNLHGMVLLAIVAAGAFAAGEALERLLGAVAPLRARASRLHPPEEAQATEAAPPDDQEEANQCGRDARAPRGTTACGGRRFLFLAALTGAVVLAALAQPSGYHLFFLGRNFTADPMLQRAIAEMQPPPPLLTWSGWDLTTLRLSPAWNLSLSFWLTLPAFLFLLAANRGRLPFAADFLLTGFFAWQAIHHWRLLPLFAIAAAGPLAWLLTRLLDRFGPRASARLHVGLLAATAILAGVFIFAVREPIPFFKRNLELLRGRVMDLGSYPRPLYDFIIRAELPDRMMSEINYCGYAIWRLSPEHHKLFTDNRFDLFGGRLYPEEAVVFEALNAGDLLHGQRVREGWRAVLDRYGVNFIVVARGRPLHEVLRAEGGWKHIAYYLPPGAPATGGYSVWLRDDPRLADAARRAALLFEQRFPGMPPPEELDRIADQMRTRRPAARRREPGARPPSPDPAAAAIPTTAPAEESR